MDITYRVNGADVHAPSEGRYVMDGTELPSIGAPRTLLTEVPGRTGVLAQPTVATGEITVAIKLLVFGDSHEQFTERLDRALNVLRPVGSFILTRVMGDVERSAPAFVSAISEPKYDTVHHEAELTVTYLIPSGVWCGAPTTVTANNLATINGGNAPYQVDRIDVIPDGGRVTITDIASGDVLAWEGEVVVGETLRLYPASFEAHWSGGVDVSEGLSLPARGWAITPNTWGNVGVQVVGAQAVNVSLVVRRAFR